MKKLLPIFLAAILILGLFGAAGYAGYRFGYVQGVQAAADGDAWRLRPFDEFDPRGMPMHDFGFGLNRGFQRWFFPGGSPMMGFGFFSLWAFLGRIAVLALIVWLIYWLFTRSGWRLTRQTTESNSSKTE